MTRRRWRLRLLVFLTALLLAACSAGGPVPTDAGSPGSTDAGTTMQSDAGALTAGTFETSTWDHAAWQ